MAQFGDAVSRPRILLLRLKADSLIRNSAVYLLGSVAAGLLGYVFHFVTGRLLGPAGYAVVASVLAALYVVTLPALVMQTVSARFVSLAVGRGWHASIPRLLLRLNAASVVVGGLLAAGLVLLAPVAAQYLQISSVLPVYVLALAALVGLLITTNRGALQGLERFWALSGNVALDMAVRVVTAGALIVAGLGVAGGVLALLAGPVVAYAQSLFVLRQRGSRDDGDTATLLEVGRYAVLATLATAGVTYLFNADVLLAKHYLPAAAAGTYAAGSVLARVVYFLGLAVAAVMFPRVTALHARDKAHFHVVDRALLLLGLIAIGLVLVYLAVPDLVILPYGHGFDPVRALLAPFAVGLSLIAVVNLLVNYFLSVNSGRFVLPLMAGCALETGLISTFHGGPSQVVAMLILSMCALAAALGGLYAVDRLRAVRRGR